MFKFSANVDGKKLSQNPCYRKARLILNKLKKYSNMAQNSKIEWTHHTANLWHGCTKVHEGCDNCYAETLAKRWGNDIWGNDKSRKIINSVFNELDKFQRIAKEANEMQRVFVGSMMDIFEKPMPLIDSKGIEVVNLNTGEIRDTFFKRISENRYPNLIFLLLTKRPSNINKYIPENWKTNPPKNVMFGTSPVNQQTFDTLTRHLLEVNGLRFLSVEPQLDKIELNDLKGIDWIIQGGESGHHKRPFNLEWARKMKAECSILNIPYFFKQIDKIQEIPTDLQVRMFPTEQVGSAFL
jgi:protein gp37